MQISRVAQEVLMIISEKLKRSCCDAVQAVYEMTLKEKPHAQIFKTKEFADIRLYVLIENPGVTDREILHEVMTQFSDKLRVT